MRLAVIAGLALATTSLSACKSTSTSEVLDVRPSREIVSSIDPIKQVPTAGADENPFPQPLALEPDDGKASPLDAFATKSSGEAPVQVASMTVQNPAPSKHDNGKHVKVYSQKFKDAKPVKFSRAVHPSNFSVHGVDVSRWQENINWVKLRAHGANFAFIKATDGGDHLDKMFKVNWNNTRAAGVPRGAYHFMYWCRSGIEQAKWFIRNVPKEKGALPPVIDAEWNHQSRSCKQNQSPALVRKRMKEFMDVVERHYGQKPIIYTAPDFYEDNLEGHFTEYPFWLRSVAEHPQGRYPDRSFTFWQYSGTGLSGGVDTQIDLNVFNGTQESWQKWLKKARHK